MQSPPLTRQEKLAWAAAFPDSGLTAQQYAALAGCSVAKIYYWRAQLKAEAEPAFTAITISDDSHRVTLHLRLPGGLEVHGSPGELAAFVRQLRDRA